MPGAQLLESGLAWYYIDGIRVFRSMNAQHIALIGVEIHLPDLRPSYELVPGLCKLSASPWLCIQEGVISK